MKTNVMRVGYFERLRHLSRPARLYLLHAALLTSSLAIFGLFFNLAIDALGYPREFLGQLNGVSTRVAVVLSLPLWWLAVRIGLRWALVASAAFNAASALVFALWPAPAPLIVASALTGVAAVLFQVSAPPFMMRHSDAESRDHLFSANTAINIGLAGVGSLVAGGLPVLFGRLLGASAESATTYRATFLVAAGGLLLSLAPLLLIVDRRPPTADRRPPTADRRPPTADRRLTTDDGQQRTTDNRQQTTDNRQRTIQNLTSKIPGPWSALLRRPGPLVRLLIPPLLISFGAALLIPYLNLFFKQRFAILDTALGAIFAGLGVATGLAALIGPLISARIGKIRTIVLTQALSLPFLLLFGFVPLLGVAVGAALVRQALFNMASPLYDAFAMERTDEAARPMVIGLINAAYSAGYIFTPEISTRIQAGYGFEPLFVATAVCYILAISANYWFFVRGRRYGSA